MKKNPDISIIVPIYNTGTYIRKCLDSLVSQQKKELEFLLINDGSTDNSEEIIKEYKDKRIRYFKNKNQGIGKTRNFAIKQATGKYIMFVDSDDYIANDACEKMYDRCEKDELDVAVCDFYRDFSNGIIIEEKLEDFDNTNLKDNPKLLNIINLSPWNKIYKRDLLVNNKIQFIEDLKYEDAPFVIEALFKANKIGKINESLNYYSIRNNSETTVRDKKCFDILKVIDMIRNKLKKEESLKQELNILTVRIITNYTIQQRVQKDKKIAIDFINESFQYLKKEVPDFKKNKYYPDRPFLKRTVEKSKALTIIYCKLYWLFKK